MSKSFLMGCAVSTLFLAACGGSESSSNSRSTTPVVTNNPPTARLVTSKSSLDEGQPFTLDASTSSDPDGDAITFTWVQRSGPSVDLSGQSSPMLSLTAPEIDADQSAEFEIQVKDREFTRTQNVTVDFVNIVQTPLIDIEAVKGQTLNLPEPVLAITDSGRMFIDETNAEGDVALMAFGPDFDSPVAYHLLYSENSESDVEILSARPFPEDSYPGGRHTVELAQDHARVLLRDDDVIIDYVGAPENTFEEERLEVKSPCSISDNLGRGQALIRTEEHGRIYRHAYSSADSHTPVSALTIDYTRDILSCEDFTSPDWRLAYWDVFGNQEIKVSEINIPAMEENPDLQLVGIELGGVGLIIVLTDGKHEGGDHRVLWFPILTQVAQAVELERWTYGVPSRLERIDLDDGKSRYLMTTSSTPHIRVYDNDISGNGLENPPPWPEPSFYEIGLGASAIQLDLLERGGFGVSFKDKQTIEFYDWEEPVVATQSEDTVSKGKTEATILQTILDGLNLPF